MSMKEIRPYERTKSREPQGWLLPSLNIAFNEVFHKKNLEGAKKVKVLAEEDSGKPIRIGVKVGQNGKSWLLKGGPQSNIRYLDLRRYFSKFDFRVEKKTMLEWEYDYREKAWITQVTKLAETPKLEVSKDSGTDPKEMLDPDEIRQQILEIIPPKNSDLEPLKIPEIRNKVKNKLRLPRWGRRMKAALNRIVRYQIKKLLEEKKLIEASKKETYKPTGKLMKFFYKSVSEQN